MLQPCNIAPFLYPDLDIDECSAGTDMCASNATCTNTEGGYNCSCDSGYHGDGFTCNSKYVTYTLQLELAINLLQILMSVVMEN